MIGDGGTYLPRPAATTAAAAHRAPLLQRDGDLRWRVTGLFHRALEPAHRASALDGSRSAGRYSHPDQPTLYLSSSLQGVAAAMGAHRAARGDLVMLRFEVRAEGIVDLRDATALRKVGVDPADAAAPWQDVVADGGVPRSWAVRQRLEALGAKGLVDPSRTSPGLWHLVLFTWNTPGAARVIEVDQPTR